MSAPLSSFRFASFRIPGQIFFQSSLSLGIVNLKPLVPGHVLVIPQRIVPRWGDLTPAEVCDLFLSAQQISKVVEKEFKAQSMNIAIQDGALAGQSVAHTHVHLIPRRPADFDPMDEVYTVLDSANIAADYAARQTRKDRKTVFGVDNDERKPRSSEEMIEEAKWLSGLFPLEVRPRPEGVEDGVDG